MQTEIVHLTKEKETLLPALYAKAMEGRSKDPVLRDTMAEAAIERIDYDFERTKLSRAVSLSVVLRAKQLDRSLVISEDHTRYSGLHNRTNDAKLRSFHQNYL